MTRFDPYFDRFDICTAYYAFASECHDGQWSEVYEIFGRLHNLQFSPGMGGCSWGTLEENEREIYCNAWIHHYPERPLPDDCQDWVRETYVPEFIEELENEGILEAT